MTHRDLNADLAAKMDDIIARLQEPPISFSISGFNKLGCVIALTENERVLLLTVLTSTRKAAA